MKLQLLLLISILILFIIYKNNKFQFFKQSVPEKNFYINKFGFKPGLDKDKSNYRLPKMIKYLLTEQEANDIINYAKKNNIMKIAGVGNNNVSKSRNNSNGWIKKNNQIVKKIYQKINNIMDLSKYQLEDLQIGYYQPGQYYKSHYDQCYRINEESCQNFCNNDGPRIKTILIYLNNDYQGGLTKFPILNQQFKLNTGDALLFENTNKQQNQVHELALHQGSEITSGEKWIANIWIQKKI